MFGQFDGSNKQKKLIYFEEIERDPETILNSVKHSVAIKQFSKWIRV